MRGAWLAVALLTAGCDHVFDLSEAPQEDALVQVQIDAPPDAPCSGDEVGTRGLVAPLCLDAASTNTNVPPAINTGTRGVAGSGDCDFVLGTAAESEICVIAAQDITLVGVVRPTGNRPLILAAVNMLVVSGTLDMSSTDLYVGPGADSTECDPNRPAQPLVGAGGGGGGFGADGGGGGTSEQVTTPPPGGVVTEPGTLRGGCAGAHGGNRDSLTPTSAPGGPGGSSGGAVYLMAGMRITITGQVLANGEGGGGGGTGGVHADGRRRTGGGGGGGSGGMIVIDAPVLVLDPGAQLVALGGGGGGGGGTTQNGSVPHSGVDGQAPAYDVADQHWRGLGGLAGITTGGAGGAGSNADLASKFVGVPGEPAMTLTGGGGGGGGGAGYIIMLPTPYAGSALVEPPAGSI